MFFTFFRGYNWKLKLLNFLVDSVLICFLVTSKYVVDEDLDSVLI